ncbi:hypothetical protein C8J56DRAFT_1078560, partial [Mycena floridula]
MADCTTFQHPPNDGSLNFVEMFDFCAEHSPSHPAFRYQSPLDNTIHDIPWKVASRASLKAGPLALVVIERALPVIGILGSSIDSMTYIVIVSGIIRAGGVPFPLSPRRSPVAIAHLLRTSGCKSWFISNEPSTLKLVRSTYKEL